MLDQEMSTEEILEISAGSKDAGTSDEITRMIGEKYWAAKPFRDPEMADAIVCKFEDHVQMLRRTVIGDVLWQAYCTQHLIAPDSDYDSTPQTTVRFGGEQGELALTDLAHYRTLIKHKKQLIAGDRLNFTPKATNSDGSSMEQVAVARNLIDYMLDQRGIEKGLRDCAEIALYLGASYMVLEWDPYQGTQTGATNPVTEAPVFSGDLVWHSLLPFDVAHEPVKDYRQARWHIVRTFDDRFELAARLRDKGDILTAKKMLAQSYSDLDYQFVVPGSDLYAGCDQVPVYTLYHDRTAAMPYGRMMRVTGDSLILDDRGLPYPTAPVDRMCPSVFAGTSVPFAESWAWLPLHEIANALMSAIVSRMDAFGHPLIATPAGQDWTPESFGPYSIVEGGVGPNGEAPALLDFAQIPPSVPAAYQLMKSEMERLSGINSVVQGQPAENIGSGSHSILIHEQAVQFASDDAEQYVMLCQNVVMGGLQIYQSRASEQMLIAITGKEGEPATKEFRGEAINKIKGVSVQRSDPAMRTSAAKQQAADTMMANGLIKSPQEYMSVVSTGTYDSIFTDATKQMALIREENAMILAGQPPTVGDFEPFHLHVPEHAALEDEYVKNNPAALNALRQHMTETMLKWQEASLKSPATLQALGIPLLPPPPQVQMAMQQAGMGPPQQGPGGPQGAPGGTPGPKPAPQAPGVDNKARKAKEPNMPNMPNMPTPPGEEGQDNG